MQKISDTMTKQELRTIAGLKALGWQGGTVHQIAEKFGIDANTMLYGEPEDTLHAEYGREAGNDAPVHQNFDVFSVMAYPFSGGKAEEHKGVADFWLAYLDALAESMKIFIDRGETVDALLRKPKVKDFIMPTA